eukprot:maker-scaffold266_size231069-snap-gene-1.25 protein:Tk12002 transcript:maker-scaffold266_size231069-snap-gene-1.25-mRNA-1 annotation:"udp-n-acetylmuramoylalanine ligase"
MKCVLPYEVPDFGRQKRSAVKFFFHSLFGGRRGYGGYHRGGYGYPICSTPKSTKRRSPALLGVSLPTVCNVLKSKTNGNGIERKQDSGGNGLKRDEDFLDALGAKIKLDPTIYMRRLAKEFNVILLFTLAVAMGMPQPNLEEDFELVNSFALSQRIPSQY